MKVGMQIRAVLQLDTILDLIDEMSIVSEADASLVFVVPYRGMEIYCTDAAEALNGALTIIRERIDARPKVVPSALPEDGR